jgi:hypothetical protein
MAKPSALLVHSSPLILHRLSSCPTSLEIICLAQTFPMTCHPGHDTDFVHTKERSAPSQYPGAIEIGNAPYRLQSAPSYCIAGVVSTTLCKTIR